MDSSSDTGSATTIDFQDDNGALSGHDQQGRHWHILEERSGWRLSFRDPGDAGSTNSGVFGTLAAARLEADGARSRR